jgi:hypothetical protein
LIDFILVRSDLQFLWWQPWSRHENILCLRLQIAFDLRSPNGHRRSRMVLPSVIRCILIITSKFTQRALVQRQPASKTKRPCSMSLDNRMTGKNIWFADLIAGQKKNSLDHKFISIVVVRDDLKLPDCSHSFRKGHFRIASTKSVVANMQWHIK